MPSDAKPVHLTLQLDAGADAGAEELDRLTRQLLGEIREVEVESAKLVTSGAAPTGAKGDPVTLGALAVLVLPSVLPKLIEVLQAWMMRGQGRTVKFKGRVAVGEIEIEGATPDELRTFLATLTQSLDSKPAAKPT